MFTPEILQESQDVLRNVLYIIFEYEGRFKDEVLGGKRCVGWDSEEYEVDKCHAATNYRVTLSHIDGRKKDIFINSIDIHSWILKLQDDIFS
jgi:hypothetical protein